VRDDSLFVKLLAEGHGIEGLTEDLETHCSKNSRRFEFVSEEESSASVQLHDEVVKAEDVTDEQKARICERVAEADKVCFSGVPLGNSSICYTLFVFRLF
jgi:hypothetical protein